jgi:hypothetical protein
MSFTRPCANYALVYPRIQNLVVLTFFKFTLPRLVFGPSKQFADLAFVVRSVLLPPPTKHVLLLEYEMFLDFSCLMFLDFLAKVLIDL